VLIISLDVLASGDLLVRAGLSAGNFLIRSRLCAQEDNARRSMEIFRRTMDSNLAVRADDGRSTLLDFATGTQRACFT